MPVSYNLYGSRVVVGLLSPVLAGGMRACSLIAFRKRKSRMAIMNVWDIEEYKLRDKLNKKKT